MFLDLCGGDGFSQQRIVPRLRSRDCDAARVVEPHGRPVVPRFAISDHREELLVRLLAAAHGRMQPSLDAEPHQLLRVGERDIVGRDGNVRLLCLFDDRAIQRRRQSLPRAVSVVDPDLDELGLHLHVVARRFPRLLDGRHRIRHVGS